MTYVPTYDIIYIMKTEWIKLRISPEEKNRLKSLSSGMGISMSEYILRAVVGWRSEETSMRDSGANGSISVSKTEDVGSNPTGPAIKLGDINKITIPKEFTKASQVAWNRARKVLD